MLSFLFLLVEKMDGKGEIGRECRPNEVRDLQIRGDARDARVLPHIRGDKNEKEQDPKGGEEEQTEAKEKDRIEEIDGKARAV